MMRGKHWCHPRAVAVFPMSESPTHIPPSLPSSLPASCRTPAGLIMVYAPRTLEDVAVIVGILEVSEAYTMS